jgi:hypothetical protein
MISTLAGHSSRSGTGSVQMILRNRSDVVAASNGNRPESPSYKIVPML